MTTSTINSSYMALTPEARAERWSSPACRTSARAERDEDDLRRGEPVLSLGWSEQYCMELDSSGEIAWP